MSNSSLQHYRNLPLSPQMCIILCPPAAVKASFTINPLHHPSLINPYPAPNSKGTCYSHKFFANLLWGISVKLSLSCAHLVIIISGIVQISGIASQSLVPYGQDRGMGGVWKPTRGSCWKSYNLPWCFKAFISEMRKLQESSVAPNRPYNHQKSCWLSRPVLINESLSIFQIFFRTLLCILCIDVCYLVQKLYVYKFIYT